MASAYVAFLVATIAYIRQFWRFREKP